MPNRNQIVQSGGSQSKYLKRATKKLFQLHLGKYTKKTLISTLTHTHKLHKDDLCSRKQRQHGLPTAFNKMLFCLVIKSASASNIYKNHYSIKTMIFVFYLSQNNPGGGCRGLIRAMPVIGPQSAAISSSKAGLFLAGEWCGLCAVYMMAKIKTRAGAEETLTGSVNVEVTCRSSCNLKQHQCVILLFQGGRCMIF